ncbi:heavy metal translocating P-type ATPase [Ectopseudomonas oleovorans]|uniref:heavy metal translocating P-type ATPase n=1 Tax=Ectopseudomonas oleovorans TaxID=301 RepID=UPI0019D084A6|nr:heavy metal translocating P-type ATPase [Pseudomonas oleovorans]MBN7118135.1 4-deoxy-4-formamido-L-arabinose-phospho-UDP deformylase [Pseudomonas oleovorans]MBN7130919.1 4-deoxy-4-formamido-L-arabinose-phospho-UDP deformylase [Pseudomonas oleovorans]MBN7142088.1 4-deoxy-4-formamido-L-arabinose-phospho-UDP deformylase [Pseudomonas oleovorans]
MSRCCDHSHQQPLAHPEHVHDHAGHNHEAVPQPADTALTGACNTRIRIEQMDCPTEERLIRDALGRLPGVAGLHFNLLQRVLTVSHDEGMLAQVLPAIRALGFTPQVENDRTAQQPAAAPAKKPWWPLALAGGVATASEIVHFAGLGPDWLVALLAVAAILMCGLNTYKKGWIALKNRNLNINALMSIAVTGAVLIGQWPEAAMVMVLFTLAELIEARSLDRARNAIRGLMDLAPPRATVQQADGSWQEIDVQAVGLGAVVRVRPGERISLDGEVVGGSSTVNQAPITGESLPVEKRVGDAVFAGTINEAGSLEFRVTAAACDTTLARIIHAVEEAQGSRAPTQRFVDQFSRIYTPVVFAFALAVAVVPPLVIGGAWLDWVYRALVLLVVACPCALVISTPVTIVSGLAAAARKGILIKGGVYLENGRNLALLALDKTGTLTHGKPVQTDSLHLLEVDEPLHATWTASLAARSDHPVSRALARHAVEQGQTLREVEDFAALPGQGIRGRIDGRLLYLGNHRLVEDLGLCSAQLEERLEALERQGKSVVVLCDEQRALMLFAVADTVRQTSREAVAELHELGVRTCMLTGDNAHTAAAIAEQVGVDEARGDLLPADKLAWVEARQAQGKVVGMVGDGINDAPALAKAEIGFAMGAAGTDTAIETADVALMDDDLRKIPAFVRLSRQTHAILLQNIVLALGIKAVFLVMTLTGEATMWMAVFADMGVSLMVVFNGLRLLRK